MKKEHIVLGLAGIGALVYLVTRAAAKEIIYVTAAEATALWVQKILGDFPLLNLLDGEVVTGTDGNRYALAGTSTEGFY